MKVPEDLKYSRTHEWVRLTDNVATVGITDHAQMELGDVVYVELPAVGARLEKDAVFGTVESVKAVSDLYSPIDGEVREVNRALTDQTEMVNTDPYGSGWLIRLTPAVDASMEHLLDAKEYTKLVEEIGQ